MMQDLVNWCWWVSFTVVGVVTASACLLMLYDHVRGELARRRARREPFNWRDHGR